MYSKRFVTTPCRSHPILGPIVGALLLAACLAMLPGQVDAFPDPPVAPAGLMWPAGPELPISPAGDASPAGVDQAAAWQAVELEGATCGRGAPYKYFLNPSADDGAGLLFVLNGGGACMKEGHAPPGVSGPARQLYCMEYSNFVDQLLSNEQLVGSLPLLIRYFRRNDAANPFRDYSYVVLPYCTGDVHAGRMTEAYDYDPDPASSFEVVHRGHLNVMAVLADVQLRYPGDRPVVLTGLSAGGFGAIFNFPAFVERWPRTTLIPDAGIAPPHAESLMAREGQRVAERWGARALLPDYCATDDCLADTLRLLSAHAEHYDGGGAPWRPFGFLQGQQDSVLSGYLEISGCSYEMGLRRGMLASQATNLRAFVPATTAHVFGATPGYKTPVGGMDMLAWFGALALATSAAELPPDAIDPWLPCNALQLPNLSARQ